MRIIQTEQRLAQLRTILRYDSVTGKFYWLCTRGGQVKVGDEAGYLHSQGYWIIETGGTQYRRNILAWAFHYNKWPVLLIDHRNRIRHDDRIDNLREATYSQNAANGKVATNNALGERGISLMKHNRFRVCLYFGGKQHYAGCYGTLEEAIKARNILAKSLHGEFASCE